MLLSRDIVSIVLKYVKLDNLIAAFFKFGGGAKGMAFTYNGINERMCGNTMNEWSVYFPNIMVTGLYVHTTYELGKIRSSLDKLVQLRVLAPGIDDRENLFCWGKNVRKIMCDNFIGGKIDAFVGLERLRSLVLSCGKGVDVDLIGLSECHCLRHLSLKCGSISNLNEIRKCRLYSLVLTKCWLPELDVSRCVGLRLLELIQCDLMVGLHVGEIRTLEKVVIRLCVGLRKLDLDKCGILKLVDVEGCDFLDTLVVQDVETLIVRQCERLVMIEAEKVEELKLVCCKNLVRVGIDRWNLHNIIISKCPMLKSFYLGECRRLRSIQLVGPQGFMVCGGESIVESVVIKNYCVFGLRELEGMKGLKDLKLIRCRVVEDWDKLSSFCELQTLTVTGCDVRAINGFCAKLEYVNFSDCLNLKDVGGMKLAQCRLKHLIVNNCRELEFVVNEGCCVERYRGKKLKY